MPTPQHPANQPPTHQSRVLAVDAVRGGAILLMAGYHFCFDINFYGQTTFHFNGDPFWLGLRAFILSLFLGTMGVSLHLAHHNGLRRRRHLRRLISISACAALVTVGSILLFPESFIYFGVLHFVAVASVLAIPFLRLDWGNGGLGLALIVLGYTTQASVFDHPALHWVGMMTYKPITEDYVPLVPWFGVVLVGLWLGRRIYGPTTTTTSNPPAVLTPLVVMGRHSLLIYMIHQPILLGLLYVALPLSH